MDGETVHCIAISVTGRPSVHIFYAKGVAERRIWAQRILEATTPIFPTKYIAEFTRAGWAYLKVYIKKQCNKISIFFNRRATN